MDLTLREAASLLGVPVRTLRARVARGDIRATKDGRHWRISRQDLPLTERQRQSMAARAEEVRQAVDAILPSRVAASTRPIRSLADLDAFRETAAVVAAMRAVEDPTLAPVTALLEAACAALGEATFVYDRDRKLWALAEARAAIGRAVATLFVTYGIPPAEPIFTFVQRLEGTVSPAVSGYARWVATLGARR